MTCANHPDRERVSFCQNCGKPLCTECTRPIGAAVFCEPCLEARLAAADAASASRGSSYSNVNVPPPYAAAPPYASASPTSPGASNPYIAGALGLIPGVGAMYNGQYAKGAVHLVVFAILVSLTDANGVFGLLIAGWVIYQAIEAYHTAQARRDGTPLPNPFGLNDIGERFGFGKSWPAPSAGAPYPPPASGAFTPASDASQLYPGSDGSRFNRNPDGSQQYVVPPAPSSAGWTGTPGAGYAIPPVPPVPPYAEQFVPTGADPSFAPPANRFPTGAIVLIGLGLLFFFGSSGIFHHFPVERIIPFFLIAVGVWIFVRKMTNTGAGLADDGSPNYQMRLFRALRSSVWVVLVGVLFFLDTFDILSWSHSWPLFIIVSGLMAIYQNSVYKTSAAASYTYPAPGPYPPPSPVPPVPSTEIVPVAPRDEEGR